MGLRALFSPLKEENRDYSHESTISNLLISLNIKDHTLYLYLCFPNIHEVGYNKVPPVGILQN